MSNKNKVSIYLSFILRHQPESLSLEMDKYGWVNVNELLKGVNNSGKYKLSFEELEDIVATDEKGRYRFNETKTLIKACQGHSISWVEPELEYREPPEFLYHGTTTESLKLIKQSGAILKMQRHAVHMQADIKMAWKSAVRWKKNPVVLKISAQKLCNQGVSFGVSENGVWCAEKIPVEYITEYIYELREDMEG